MLGWIFGAIGILGIGGFIALAFVAPHVAGAIINIVIEILGRLLKTRGGVCALTAAVCLAFGYFAFDYNGAQRVRLQWREANAAAAAAVANRDASISTQAKTKSDKAAAAEENADKANAEDRDAFIAELEKRAAGVCIDTDADIKRLFNER